MKITTNFTQINVEMAIEFLSFKYENQRKTDNAHVSFLAHAMRKGRFQPTAQVGIAVVDGAKALINGRHTLSAVVATRIPQWLNITYYYCKNWDEVADLYGHFDIGKSRTLSDAINAQDALDKSGLSCKNHVNQTASALKYMRSGFADRKIKMANEDVLGLLYEWSEYAVKFFDILKGAETVISTRMRSMGAMSVFLVILRYNPESGEKFIRQVANDDGLRSGDPRKALNKYLLQSKRTHNNERAIRNSQVSRACAKAWNKWNNGVSIKTIRVSMFDTSKPIMIRDTPFTGEFETVL